MSETLEPAVWQGRMFFKDEMEWGEWQSIDTCDMDSWRRRVETWPERFELRPLYATLSIPLDGWREAAIAWEVCASIHREYAKRKDAFFSTRQADFVKHAADARAANISPSTICCRITLLGWDEVRAVTTPSRGRGKARAKLSEGAVLAMRKAAANGATGKELAALFGVSHSAACRAIAGDTWPMFDKAIAAEETKEHHDARKTP